MPFIQVSSNTSFSEAEKKNSLLTLSSAVAELLDKKETYVMTAWNQAKMTMGATDAPTAFIELRAIRLPEDQLENICKELTERFALTSNIVADRIFINFTDMSPQCWGWNGKTFG